jgi:hypothetical protein
MAALCSCSCGHDSCLSNPCQHNGGCINTGDDAYACSCDLAHWAGANCEQDVDECLSDNGGCGAALCHDTPGASRCGLDTCASGPCQASPFFNLFYHSSLRRAVGFILDTYIVKCGAICAFTCICVSCTLTGARAQHDATCTNTGDDEYGCACPVGWQGGNCADDVDDCVPQKGDLPGDQYGGAATVH